MWIAGLKSLLSSGQGGRSKIDGWGDGGLYLDVTPVPYALLYFYQVFIVHPCVTINFTNFMFLITEL